MANRVQTILLTGATGYVGGRLLRPLEANPHIHVRCLTRRPGALIHRVADATELVRGDVLDPRSLAYAMRGVHTAYYLVHSMGSRGDFEALDRVAARNFGVAAKRAGVSQIIYLGGLGDGDLSPHLASRREVGDILRASGVPTVEFRASIVIGSGSASYETVRALAETLPVMIAPRWANTAAQPIAIEDLLGYLVAALGFHGEAIFEVGGRDRVTYIDILTEYARQRGLKRRLIAVPLLSPRASRFFLSLLTPVYGRVAGAMVESLRNETVVNTSHALHAFGGVSPRGLRDAIGRALINEDQEFAQTRWSDSFAPGQALRWGGLTVGRRLVSSRVIHVRPAPSCAFDPIRRIGGETGWYGNEWFWKARGLLDTLRGGVGLRRGRRDQVDLRVGDTVDFWRVERIEQDRLLRLAAEMKIPGRLWLQFEVAPDREAGTHIRQTTVFDPAGWVGLAYWYLLCPIHHLVFGRMIHGLARAVPEAPGSFVGARSRSAVAASSER